MQSRIQKRIEAVKKMKGRAGKSDLLKFLNGDPITRNQAIKAACYACVNGEDFSGCQIEICPLLSYCPWNKPIQNKAVSATPQKQEG